VAKVGKKVKMKKENLRMSLVLSNTSWIQVRPALFGTDSLKFFYVRFS
jgi:hypothetical protein